MRGQSSVEILLALTVIFTIVVLLHSTIIQPQSARALQTQILLEARTTCETIAAGINLVAASGNNFTTTIKIPQFLNFIQPYNATVYNTAVFIDWEKSSVNCPIRAKRILLKVSPARDVTLAYQGRETCLYNEVQRFSPKNYCNAQYQDIAGCSNYCLNYSTAQRDADHQMFLNNLSTFDILFLEDSHYTEEDISDLENLAWNKNTYWFFSEHIRTGDDHDMFGAVYGGGNGNNNATIILSDDILTLKVGTQILPTQKATMAANITKMAVYSDDKPAISSWSYGPSKLYHFSDFDVQYFTNFTKALIDSVNISLTFLANYKEPDFQLNKTTYKIHNDRGDVILE